MHRTEKFKSLTFKEKAEYIWDYYRLHILAVVVAAALISFIIVKFINKPDYQFCCIVLNDSGNTELEKHIKSFYSEHSHIEENKISVDLGYSFSYMKERGLNWPDEASSVKYVKLQTTKEADVAITDYNSMLWAQDVSFLTPVKDILPEDLWNRLEPYFVYAVFQGDSREQGDGVVYGLDISGTDFYQGYAGNYEDAILCFPNVSQHTDKAVDFVKYLFENTFPEK